MKKTITLLLILFSTVVFSQNNLNLNTQTNDTPLNMLETSDRERLNKNVFVIVTKDQNIRVYAKDIVIKKVEVFDLMGRFISGTYDINNNFVEIRNITQTNEVQIVNIYTEIGRINKKIITR